MSISSADRNNKVRVKVNKSFLSYEEIKLQNCLKLTIFDAEAAGPLLQSDVVVLVSIACLEEAGGAVLHGDKRGTQRGQFSVGQEAETYHSHFCNEAKLFLFGNTKNLRKIHAIACNIFESIVSAK